MVRYQQGHKPLNQKIYMSDICYRTKKGPNNMSMMTITVKFQKKPLHV